LYVKFNIGDFVKSPSAALRFPFKKEETVRRFDEKKDI